MRHRLEDRGHFAHHASVSRDGRRLLTSSGTSACRLWEVATGTQVLLLTGHSAPAQEVAFSGDGQCVVSAGSDGGVRIWHARGFVGGTVTTASTH